MDDRRTDTHELTSTAPDPSETTSSHGSSDTTGASIPGNAPGSAPASPPSNLHEFPPPVPSITNSPGCTPARRSVPPRRARPVRVDAWAVPVSVSWTRTGTMLRKVNRHSHATNWALPF
jgi:hypothetical protein